MLRFLVVFSPLSTCNQLITLPVSGGWIISSVSHKQLENKGSSNCEFRCRGSLVFRDEGQLLLCKDNKISITAGTSEASASYTSVSGGQPIRQPCTHSQGQVKKLREAAGEISRGVVKWWTQKPPWGGLSADNCFDKVATWSGSNKVIHDSPGSTWSQKNKTISQGSSLSEIRAATNNYFIIY